MDTVSVRTPEVENAIRLRAEKLYEARGRVAGHEVEDWLQAEAEILREVQCFPKVARVAVHFEGATYIGEYDAQHCDGYTRGEFRAGTPVELRFAGQTMFMKRPNGKELKTVVVRRETDK
jgi:hypothetical protein